MAPFCCDFYVVNQNLFLMVNESLEDTSVSDECLTTSNRDKSSFVTSNSVLSHKCTITFDRFFTDKKTLELPCMCNTPDDMPLKRIWLDEEPMIRACSGLSKL